MKTLLKRLRAKWHSDLTSRLDELIRKYDKLLASKNDNDSSIFNSMAIDDKICMYPFNFFGTSVGGNVSPCCTYWCNYYLFGNLFESHHFEDIWNSESAREFRKSIFDGSYKYCDKMKCLPVYIPKEEIMPYLKLDGTYTKYPSMVKFSHDYSCNVQCITCRDKLNVCPKEETIKLDALIDSHFIPVLRDAKLVSLDGSGELFASSHCRNLIKKIIKTYPDIKFQLHTNGILCDKKNCEKLELIDRIDSLLISIHAATQEIYSKIVKNGNFEKVMENIRWLSKLKKEGKINTITLSFVVHVLNFHEMKKFMEMANDLDVIASFWHYEPWGGGEADKKYEEYAVFKPAHPEYKKMAELLKDDIFKSANCYLNGILRNVKVEK
ncbi:hypothetical protein FACS1894190_05300 [Spirochaetia bacterium]|nr:hypothetical protein FACS1894190_05300 [Spirochaetia bacterium]